MIFLEEEYTYNVRRSRYQYILREDCRIRTSNARRDIAVAKNMQITIPANVLYLGPINSRAVKTFSIS